LIDGNQIVRVVKIKFINGIDFRTFGLYLSEAVLEGLLPDLYLQHWRLFVKAYRILSKDKITLDEIDFAESCLRSFVEEIPRLYLPNHISIKVHLLLHLCDTVRRFGPLKHTSAYKWEDQNGHLKDTNHATHKPTQQLHDKFMRRNFMSTILHSMADVDGTPITREHPYYAHLCNLGWCDSECKQLETHLWKYMIGYDSRYMYRKESSNFSIQDFDLPHVRQSIQTLATAPHANVELFNKFSIGTYLYYTQVAAVYENDSSWIVFHHNGVHRIGQLMAGVHVNSSFSVVVDMLSTLQVDDYIVTVCNDDVETVIIDVKNIVCGCVCIDRGNEANPQFVTVTCEWYTVPRLTEEQRPQPFPVFSIDYSDNTAFDALVSNEENRL
jgi:hypothetical protein